MKKVVILAAAALTLAACAKTYEVEPVNGPAIGFKTWANGMTKVRTAGESVFGNGDSFVVEGVKTVSSSPVEVFQNVPVSTTDGTNWTYTNTRYWDSNATAYAFYAVSSPDTDLSFGIDGKIAATDVTFTGANNDILLANSVDVAPANYGKPVDFTFKHIGALVDLNVKKAAALSDATVAITNLSLEKIDGAGKVAVNGYSTNVPSVNWSNLDGNTTYTNNATLPTDLSTTATGVINNLVVIPQTLTDTKILKISYTITDKANNTNTFNNVAVKLNEFDKVDNTENKTEDVFITSWDASTHYTYTLTIAANAITFTADITDWTNVSGYNYLVK
ncbi:MAG: fimbrillin family protein [Bacteroidales bacterium]|jgi:hypothetical protein|nr:fimbrillin family protein [Bacteroidales bacterium]